MAEARAAESGTPARAAESGTPARAAGSGEPAGAAESGTPVLRGAEPIRSAGTGPYGALCLHGFTGSPHSMRGVAGALAGAGFSVSAPLLPGHGTTIDDMMTTGWDDWFGAAEAAYAELAATVDRVVVAGLSMGGTLTVALAAVHPGIAGIVVVNPYIDPPAPAFRELVQGVLDSGSTAAPAIGSDIADASAEEVGYQGTPLLPLLSLCEGLDWLAPRLADVACPVLLFTSRDDHVVPTVSSDILAEAVSAPVERVSLERSFHVATLDYDRDEIERRAVEFALKVMSRGSSHHE